MKSTTKQMDLALLASGRNIALTTESIVVTKKMDFDHVKLKVQTLVISSDTTLIIQESADIHVDLLILEKGACIQFADSQGNGPFNMENIETTIANNLRYRLAIGQMIMTADSKLHLNNTLLEAKNLNWKGEVSGFGSVIKAPKISWTGQAKLDYMLIFSVVGNLQLPKDSAYIEHTIFAPLSLPHSEKSPTKLSFFGGNEFKDVIFYHPNGHVELRPTKQSSVFSFMNCQIKLKNFTVTNSQTNFKQSVIETMLLSLRQSEFIYENSQVEVKNRVTDENSLYRSGQSSVTRIELSYSWGKTEIVDGSSFSSYAENHFANSHFIIEDSQTIVKDAIHYGSIKIDSSQLKIKKAELNGESDLRQSQISSEEISTTRDSSIMMKESQVHVKKASILGNVSLHKTEDQANQLKEKQEEKEEEGIFSRAWSWVYPAPKKQTLEKNPNLLIVENELNIGQTGTITGEDLTVFGYDILEKQLKEQLSLEDKKYEIGMSHADMLKTLPPQATSSDMNNCLYHAVLCSLFEFLLTSSTPEKTISACIDGEYSFLNYFNQSHNTNLNAKQFIEWIKSNQHPEGAYNKIAVELLAPTLRELTHDLCEKSSLDSIGKREIGHFQDSAACYLLAIIFNINIYLYNQKDPEQAAEAFNIYDLKSIQTEPAKEALVSIVIAQNANGKHFETCGFAGQRTYLLSRTEDHYEDSENLSLDIANKKISQSLQDYLEGKTLAIAQKKKAKQSSSLFQCKGAINVKNMMVKVDDAVLNGAMIHAVQSICFDLNGKYKAQNCQFSANSMMVTAAYANSFNNYISCQDYMAQAMVWVGADIISSQSNTTSTIANLSLNLPLPNTPKKVGHFILRGTVIIAVTTVSILSSGLALALASSFGAYSTTRAAFKIRSATKQSPAKRSFRDIVPIVSALKDIGIIATTLGVGYLKVAHTSISALFHIKKASVAAKYLMSNPHVMINRALSILSVQTEASVFSLSSGLGFGGLHQTFDVIEFDAVPSIYGYEGHNAILFFNASPEILGDQMINAYDMYSCSHTTVYGQSTIIAHSRYEAGKVDVAHAAWTIDHVNNHGKIHLQQGRLQIGSFENSGIIVTHASGHIGDLYTAGQFTVDDANLNVDHLNSPGSLYINGMVVSHDMLLSGETTLDNGILKSEKLVDQSHLQSFGNSEINANHLFHTGEWESHHGSLSVVSPDAHLKNGSANIDKIVYKTNGNPNDMLSFKGDYAAYHVNKSISVITNQKVDTGLTHDIAYEIYADNIHLQTVITTHDVIAISSGNIKLDHSIQAKTFQAFAAGNIYDTTGIKTQGGTVLVSAHHTDLHNALIDAGGNATVQGAETAVTYDPNTAHGQDGMIHARHTLSVLATDGDANVAGGVLDGETVNVEASGDVNGDIITTHEGHKPHHHAVTISSGAGGTHVSAGHDVNFKMATLVSQGENHIAAGHDANLTAQKDHIQVAEEHKKHKDQWWYRDDIQRNTLAAKGGNFVVAGHHINSEGTRFDSDTGNHLDAEKVNFKNIVGEASHTKHHHDWADDSVTQDRQEYVVKNEIRGAYNEAHTTKDGIIGDAPQVSGAKLVLNAPGQSVSLHAPVLHSSYSVDSHGLTVGKHHETITHHSISTSDVDPYLLQKNIRDLFQLNELDISAIDTSTKIVDHTYSEATCKSKGLMLRSDQVDLSTSYGSFVGWDIQQLEIHAQNANFSGIYTDAHYLTVDAKQFTIAGISIERHYNSHHTELGIGSDRKIHLSYDQNHTKTLEYQGSEWHIQHSDLGTGTKVVIDGSLFETNTVKATNIDLALEAEGVSSRESHLHAGASSDGHLEISGGRGHSENVASARFDVKENLTDENFKIRHFENNASVLHSQGKINLHPDQVTLSSAHEVTRSWNLGLSASDHDGSISLGGSLGYDNDASTIKAAMYGDQGTVFGNADPQQYVLSDDQHDHHHSTHIGITVPEIQIHSPAVNTPVSTMPVDAEPPHPAPDDGKMHALSSGDAADNLDKSPNDWIQHICRSPSDSLSSTSMFADNHWEQRISGAPLTKEWESPAWLDTFTTGSEIKLDYALRSAEDSTFFVPAYKAGFGYTMHVIANGGSEHPFQYGGESFLADEIAVRSCMAMGPGSVPCTLGLLSADLAAPYVNEYNQFLHNHYDELWSTTLEQQKIYDVVASKTHFVPTVGGFPAPPPAVSFQGSVHLVDWANTGLQHVSHRQDAVHHLITRPR